ncbi:hypothetical protein ACFQ07_07565 [Actinomadura adrarensis]|uniref:Tetracyclin repressor-like C-terminal domain-containing protein n=1 Tax=Actinomadura adrarensis TaxID=1819600 RepID=A0ABW3CDR2_9ACTN
MSVMVGVMIGDRLLALPPLNEASRDRIAELLRPSLQSLLDHPDRRAGEQPRG